MHVRIDRTPFQCCESNIFTRTMLRVICTSPAMHGKFAAWIALNNDIGHCRGYIASGAAQVCTYFGIYTRRVFTCKYIYHIHAHAYYTIIIRSWPCSTPIHMHNGNFLVINALSQIRAMVHDAGESGVQFWRPAASATAASHMSKSKSNPIQNLSCCWSYLADSVCSFGTWVCNWLKKLV